MALPNEPNSLRAQHNAQQRQERITLRFPCPARPTPVSRDPQQSREVHAERAVVQSEPDSLEVEHGDWFRAGALLAEENQEQRTARSPLPSSPDRVLRPRPLHLAQRKANLAQRKAKNPHRARRRTFLAAIVSGTMIGAVLLIGAGLMSRSASVRAHDARALASVTLLPAPRAAHVTESLPLVSSSPSHHATVRPTTPTSVPRQHSRQPPRMRHAHPPTATNAAKPSIPVDDVYVNSRGELVDPEGKPLDSPPKPTAAASDNAQAPATPRPATPDATPLQTAPDDESVL